MRARKDKSLLWLIVGLFWISLAVTIAFVSYTVVIPTPIEWGIVTGELQRSPTGNATYVSVPNATSFPNDFSCENLTKAVVRHLSVFPEHINSTFLITTVSFAFLTMFIRNIGNTIEKTFKNGKTLQISNYVDWAIGSLISGILFFSSNIDVYDVTQASISITIIVVFAFVSYYVLYELGKKLKEDEEKEDGKKEGLLKMKNQNGKRSVTDD